jgi:hypothetical protein
MKLEEARRVRDGLAGQAGEAARRLSRPSIFARMAGFFSAERAAPTTSLGISLGEGESDHGLVLLTTEPPEIAAEIVALLERQAGPVELLSLEQIRPRQATAPPDPASSLRIGSPVGHYLMPAGSLGAFARDRVSGRLGILSNNHVLAAINQGVKGHRILFHMKNGTVPKIGELERAVALKPGGAANAVDAAFALLQREPDDISDVGGQIRLSGRTIQPSKVVEASKFGWKSKHTEGRVKYVDFPDINVDYGPLVCTFKDLIAVHSGSDRPFSADGDSGSLVVNESGDAVGLIMAGGVSRDGLSDLTLICPIDPVLNLLNVDLAH